MIKFFDKEVGKDIEIMFTGLRLGEKLFEELFHEQESLIQTNYKKYCYLMPEKWIEKI